MINISTVYLCAIYCVSVWHYYHFMSQRYGNCLTSKNVRRELYCSRFCETAWIEIGIKLRFADKFTRLSLSKQIHIQRGCANDVAISLKRLKRGTWSVHLINYGTDITSTIGMKNAQSSRGMFLQQCWNYEKKHAICMSHVYHIYVYIYKSTTKQNNIRHSTYITSYNSRRFEYKLFFRLRQLNDWKTIRWVKYT